MRKAFLMMMWLGCSGAGGSIAVDHAALMNTGTGAGGCPPGYEANASYDPDFEDPEWACVFTGAPAAGGSTGIGGGDWGPGGTGASTSEQYPCYCAGTTCFCTGDYNCKRMIESQHCEGYHCVRESGKQYVCTCDSSGYDAGVCKMSP
jgi:hypothetical protein